MKKYLPEDLLFDVCEAKTFDDDPPEEVGCCVTFVTRNFWKRHGCLSDRELTASLPRTVLDIGLCESTESVFEGTYGVEETTQRLLGVGCQQDPEFTAWLQKFAPAGE